MIVSRVVVAVDAVSSVVGVVAVTAGGASRPHSQLEEPSDGSGVVSVSASQHEWDSVAGSGDRFMWQSPPSPHRPQAPAIGAAITRPGKSRATIATVRMESPRVILIFEQYCTYFHFVKVEDSI